MRRAFPIVVGLAVAAAVILLFLLMPSGEEVLDIPGIEGEGGTDRQGFPGTRVPASRHGEASLPGSNVPGTNVPTPGEGGSAGSGAANPILFGGQVLEDESEQPIPGAGVRAWGGSVDFPPSVSLPQRLLGSSVTGADGGFLLTGIPRGESFLISVEAAGFEHVRSLEYEEKDLTDREFHLRKGCRLRGTVIDARGEPVTGALVFALPFDEADFQPFGDPMEALGPTPLVSLRTFASATTDANGQYSIGSIEPGSIAWFWAVAQGPGGGRGIAQASKDPEDPEDTEGFLADVRLLGNCTLVLRARLPWGEPLFSGHVYLFTPAGELLLNQLGGPRGGETGEDGRCTVHNLPLGDLVVHLWPDHCRPVALEISLRSGKTTRLQINLQTGLDLDGIVVNAKGEAISGASVSALPEGGSHIGWDVKARSGGRFGPEVSTDGKGEFHLASLPEGLVRIVADHGDYCSGSLVGRAGDRNPLRIVLPSNPRFTGVVRFPTSTSPPKIQILPVCGESGSPIWHPLDVSGGFHFTWRAYVEKTAKVHGLFLYILVGGWPPIRRGPLYPEPGGLIDLGDLAKPTCRAVTGTVRDPKGEPVPGVEVKFTVPWEYFDIDTTTDEKGVFTLDDVPFWEGWLTAQHRDFPPEPKWIGETDTGPLDFSFSEAATVEGHVVNRAGSGCWSCDVWIRPEGKYGDEDPRAAETETDAQGFFRFQNMRPGSYKIFLQPRSVAIPFWAWDRELPGPAVQIESGEKKTVEIVIDE